MSTSSQVSLGALRLQAQQRSDMENNPAISTPEWNSYLTNSYKELYDLLVSAYGNEYHVANTYSFNLTSNAQAYALPDGTTTYTDSAGGTAAKFYKLLGVDLKYSASPTGYVSLQRYEMIERNKYAYPNTATNFNGYTNLKYRIQGDSLYFIPIPMGAQEIRVWYIPAPTNLQYIFPAGTSTSGYQAVVKDATGLTAGMNVYGTGVLANTTISSIATNTLTLSNASLATYKSTILSFWDDSTLMEGISGWEEYIIIDSAIKAHIKQENDFSGFAMQKAEMKARIEAMAEGRDAGQAHHSSDALSINSFGGYGGNDGGFGAGGLY